MKKIKKRINSLIYMHKIKINFKIRETTMKKMAIIKMRVNERIKRYDKLIIIPFVD